MSTWSITLKKLPSTCSKINVRAYYQFLLFCCILTVSPIPEDSLSLTSQLSCLQEEDDDLAVIPPETMCDLLIRAFRLNRAKALAYERAAYDSCRKKSNAKVA